MISAEEMNALAKDFKSKKKEQRIVPIDEMIERHIELHAKNGRYYAEFISEEKISYIELHKADYVERGFDVTIDSDYGFPMATISWY